MKKLLMAIVVTVAVALPAGYFLNEAVSFEEASGRGVPTFHDIRINPVETYTDLINPDDPEIIRLAKQLATPEEAYRFVSDEIAFAPFVPSGPVAGTLKHKMGSCLGKAVLLCSLYRAMGLPQENVRIVMGIVVTPDGYADHVWIDMEYRGKCLQQDPSGMLGRFDFLQFPQSSYAQTYVMKESFCFNETDFAIVSQLNSMRDASPQERVD